jgi:SnoaL-like domain
VRSESDPALRRLPKRLTDEASCRQRPIAPVDTLVTGILAGLWEAIQVPWPPELFSASALARLKAEERREMRAVPYYAGLLVGEIDALVGAFTGEPELHDPIRGRIKGERAFAAYARDMKAWLEESGASIERIDRIVTRNRGVEEDVVHLGGEGEGIEVPVAIVVEQNRGRIDELRIYHSNWTLGGYHTRRSPLLQADPELREPDFVAEYQRALAAGDHRAIVAMFEPDGYAREPAGGEHVHRGPEGLRVFYEGLFSNGGGIPLVHCAITEDDRACALEYNVVQWGRTELPPEAGIAVYVRGESGKLAAARVYDDVDPPIGGDA